MANRRWFQSGQSLFFGLFLATLAGGCRTENPEHQRVVKVAAAADLKFVFEDLAAQFEQAHADIHLKITYGSSGNFFAQLSNRAPFDVFFSADRHYPQQLLEEGLAVKESEFVYAIGHLVLWVPKTSPLEVEKRGIEVLTDASVKKIAIANPKFAPYGRAAEATLKKLGVYERVRSRLVLGDNIAQTAQFVDSGAADVGLLSLSLALAPALRDRGRYWRVPDSAHPPLEQAAVIMTWAGDRQAAQSLCDYVRSAPGKALLQRYGFAIPGE